METISRLRYFIYLSLLIVGCTTGKNALQKGDYDASVMKAVNRLQNAPQNREAKEVLASAYKLSLTQHLRAIEEARLSPDRFKWETISQEYRQINALGEEISRSPVALSVIDRPAKYIVELNESNFNAAEVRFNSGMQMLREGTKIGARKAFYEFEKVRYYYPEYKDLKQKSDDAYWAAVLKVVVQPTRLNSKYYQFSNDYFQQKVNEWTSGYRNNKFVIFYDEAYAIKYNVIPDQILRLQFDDFVVGQTYVKERVEKLKRDSVKIGETRANGPIYGTVKASLSIFEKQVTSSGLLAMEVFDYQSKKILRQRKLAGSYVWADQWATFNGDERALTKEQIEITKRKELNPPAPSALFLEFTKPIYSQLVSEISNYYDRY